MTTNPTTTVPITIFPAASIANVARAPGVYQMTAPATVYKVGINCVEDMRSALANNREPLTLKKCFMRLIVPAGAVVVHPEREGGSIGRKFRTDLLQRATIYAPKLDGEPIPCGSAWTPTLYRTKYTADLGGESRVDLNVKRECAKGLHFCATEADADAWARDHLCEPQDFRWYEYELEAPPRPRRDTGAQDLPHGEPF